MRYIAGGGERLECPYCKTKCLVSPSGALVRQEALKELDFAASLAPPKPRSVACGGCGANIVLPLQASSLPCPYCQNVLVAQSAMANNGSAPSALIPLQVDAAEAQHMFLEWLKSTPADVAQRQKAKRLAPVYFPYWTFDARVSGTYCVRIEREGENGRTETSTCTDSISKHFDDVLVPASESVPHALLYGLEPWHLDKLEPYRVEFVTGVPIENASLDLSRGRQLLEERIRQKTEDAIRKIPGVDDAKITSMDIQLDDVKFRHILLPLWVGSVERGDKEYPFVINGRSAEVRGEVPIAARDIVSLIVTLLKYALLIYLGFKVLGFLLFR
ncbi:hypothetical protein [Viridibacterium curvum]